ncbi:AraC family transcriptional regulator [Vitiosangium sp. GDMCC 1.1324]|uniref:AraC family transcriptional regulator n=1 Tax=Vitiosangium sp. (strain GDMCC 1.1324) TaxID=2138576 RepID=UPI001E5F67E8|nr:AraC family transcriptional regulator [Vitiosangium sp. GDMCC 1.1324]
MPITPDGASDPFADILRLTEASSVVSGGFSARGDWALRFPSIGKLKLAAVARGTCLLQLDGQKRCVRLEEGDVVFLPGRQGFVLASSLSIPPKDARRVREGFAQLGDGEEPECVVLSGVVSPHPSSGSLLSEVLPELVHVRGASPEAALLQWLLKQILEERRGMRPGRAIASELLTQLLFVQALRAHMEGAGQLPSGWLRAIRDERIAPALRLMHGDPGRKWTIGELAKASAMSRTSFATHFKSVAGVAPLSYLTKWRMRLAQRALREDPVTISQIAASLGYTSESAFSNAFKRVTGSAPRHYRHAARGHTSTSPEDGDFEFGPRTAAKRQASSEPASRESARQSTGPLSRATARSTRTRGARSSPS